MDVEMIKLVYYRPLRQISPDDLRTVRLHNLPRRRRPRFLGCGAEG